MISDIFILYAGLFVLFIVPLLFPGKGINEESMDFIIEKIFQAVRPGGIRIIMPVIRGVCGRADSAPDHPYVPDQMLPPSAA